MITQARRTIAGLTLFTCLLVGLGLAQTPRALPKLPIGEQKQMFLKAVADVLAKNPGEAADVRILGMGSWMGDMKGTVNDIDATFGHPNPRVEERLVKDINALINARMPAGYAPHAIKLIKDQDPDFPELFRGPTGQLFALRYAEKTAPNGLATMRWEVREDGTVVQAPNIPAKDWFHETGKKLPDQITEPQLFLEDLAKFAKNAEGDPLTRSLTYAKHLDNVDSFLLPEMRTQYNNGNPIDAMKIDAGLLRQMKILKDLKATGKSGAELRDVASKMLNVDPSKVDGVADDFMKKVEKYLERGRKVASIVDEMHWLIKFGQMPGVTSIDDLPPDVLNRILTTGATLWEWTQANLGPGGLDKPGLITDIGLLAHQFGTGTLSAEDLETTLLSWGFPPAKVAAIVADLGQIFVGGLTMGFNAAINDPLLQRIFNPNNPYWVYGEKPPFIFGTANPFSEIFKFNFQGNALSPINPETLYCASVRASVKPGTPDEPDEPLAAFRQRLNRPAEEYVKLLKGESQDNVFLTAGGGAFSPQLIVDRLAADWSKGQKMRGRLRDMENVEKTQVFERPRMPFLVKVDGARVYPELRKMFPRQTKPGQPVAFKLTLQRQFGTVRFLRSNIKLVDEWCKQGGMKPLVTWLRKSQEDPNVYYYHYDTGKPEPGKPENVQHEVDVRNVTAWLLDGQWPLSPGQPFGGRLKAQGPIIPPLVLRESETRVTKQSSPFRAKDYQLRLTPGPDAGPVRIDMTFRFTDTFGIEAPKGAASASPAQPVTAPPKEPVTTPYQMVLTASVQAPPQLTEAAPPPATRIPSPPEPRIPPPPVPPPPTPPRRAELPPPPPDYAPVCQSLMTAIERRHRATYGPQAQVRVEWVKPFAYDKGDCVGGYILWVKRPEDKQVWAPTRWFADTGDGRVKVSAAKAQYGKDNPDLRWEPTITSGSSRTASSSPPRAEPPPPPPSTQSQRWQDLARQGAEDAARKAAEARRREEETRRQRELDAQRRQAEEDEARRRADAERRRRAEEDRAELEARNRPPASDPTPPRVPQGPTQPSQPPPCGWPSDFVVEMSTHVSGRAGANTRTDVLEIRQNKLTVWNKLTTSEGTFKDGVLKGTHEGGEVFEFRLNPDGTGVWNVGWVEGQPRRMTREGNWTIKPLGGSASTLPCASPPKAPPPTTPPPTQGPPCPPAPLPQTLENLATNLRCFGIQ